MLLIVALSLATVVKLNWLSKLSVAYYYCTAFINGDGLVVHVLPLGSEMHQSEGHIHYIHSHKSCKMIDRYVWYANAEELNYGSGTLWGH